MKKCGKIEYPKPEALEEETTLITSLQQYSQKLL